MGARQSREGSYIRRGESFSHGSELSSSPRHPTLTESSDVSERRRDVHSRYGRIADNYTSLDQVSLINNWSTLVL